MKRIFVFLLLAACNSPGDTTGDDDDSTAEPSPDPTPEPPAELAELSEGECPSFDAPGNQSFQSGGTEREAVVLWEEGTPTEGQPILFFWHALGTTPEYWISQFDLDSLDDDFIVVVPRSRESELFEWHWQDGEGDSTLYDDLRTCVVDHLGGDVRRVVVAGFSAGAIWTSWLTMHRADTLAASVVMSGGLAPTLAWEEPAHPVPVLLTSGGDTDVYGGFLEFEATTDAFQDELRAVDVPVVRCRHDYGHTPPPGALDAMEAWAKRHSYGEEGPWFTGERALDDLLDGCEIVE